MVIIFVAVLLIIAFIVGDILAVKYIIAEVGKPIQLGPSYTLPDRILLSKDHIIAIATVIMPTALVIVNIVLVVITLYV